MKTELRDRTLWYDGTNQIDADDVPSLLMSGCHLDKIVVTELTDAVRQFNLISDDILCAHKEHNAEFKFDWRIPQKYKEIDLEAYLKPKLESLDERYKTRAENELVEIKRRNLVMLFRTLIYIVDTFKKTNTVWGVGRGSSCACLILNLIGLHKVDPIKYKIPMTEFFHD